MKKIIGILMIIAILITLIACYNDAKTGSHSNSYSQIEETKKISEEAENVNSMETKLENKIEELEKKKKEIKENKKEDKLSNKSEEELKREEDMLLEAASEIVEDINKKKSNEE